MVLGCDPNQDGRMNIATRRRLALVTSVICLGGSAAVTGTSGRNDTKTSVHRAPGAAHPIGPSPVADASPGTGPAVIVGTAWTADNLPIKEANLRLRNVVTGKVQATTTANDSGRFVFEGVPGGSYVVELLNAKGRVEVVGHVITIGPGETIATFVRARTHVPWFTGFFNNTVAAVASAAASQGVTAIAPLARPASARQ
jgi:hypothetical protein